MSKVTVQGRWLCIVDDEDKHWGYNLDMVTYWELTMKGEKSFHLHVHVGESVSAVVYFSSKQAGLDWVDQHLSSQP